MNTCLHCKGEVNRSNPRANNKKFCSSLCRNEYPENKAKRDEIIKNSNRNKYNKKEVGKIKCLLCNGWYHRPITHTRQVHEINEFEYKEMAGLNRGRGVISEISREKSREAVLENYDLVVTQNLLNKGSKTRFQKGGKGVGLYERRPETMAVLKRLKVK